MFHVEQIFFVTLRKIKTMQLFGYDIRVRRGGQKMKPNRVIDVDFFQPKKPSFDFAKSEILDCEKMICDRLKNVKFSSKINFLTCQQIFDYVIGNSLQFVQRIFFDGYVIFDCRAMQFADVSTRKGYMVDNKVTFSLAYDEILLTSETFEATGKSDYEFLKNKLHFLNVINSSDLNLIDNYGAMGIVSPESDNSVAGAMFDDNDIDEMQENYRQHYGIKVGKWSLMFVPKPTKYTKIDLPISALQLAEKRRYVLQSIFTAFGIPKELSVYFESSKYANRNEAELDFYSNTITKWANLLLVFVKKIYDHKRRTTDSHLLENEFWFDFVGVLALQDAQQKQKESAKLEFEFWQNVKASYPQYAETAEKRISDLIENL